MSEMIVRFNETQDLIIDKLLELGVFKTKSEVIRASIFELGKEYKIFDSAKDLEKKLVIRKIRKMEAEVNNGKRKKYTMEEVMKKLNISEDDLS